MFSKFFIDRPIFATVLALLIVVAGLVTLGILPIAQYPDITPPTVQVSAVYPGANAQTVAQTVGIPIEQQVNGVDGMLYMSSNSSSSGAYSLTITFAVGTDIDMATVQVQNRVSVAQSSLPTPVVVQGVTVQKQSSNIVMFLTMTSDSKDYDGLYLSNYAKLNLVDQLTRVPGVGAVNVMGAGDYSMRIWLKPDVMAQYKLIPNDVVAALSEQNIEAAPGQLGERGNQTYQYTLRYKGRLQQTTEFENIVIKALENGEILRLKDVANVELGRLSYGFNNMVNGHKAVSCIIFQMAGSNATQTISDIEALLDDYSSKLPAGLKINIAQSANDFLFASIHEVIKTLIEAFILVFIVVYIFLQDMRSTLIPAIAIPVALIATFFVLKLIGFSINLLTLSAMVLAIAIVVDDAIVVVEGVHAKLDQGYKSARTASIDAMSELGGSV